MKHGLYDLSQHLLSSADAHRQQRSAERMLKELQDTLASTQHQLASQEAMRKDLVEENRRQQEELLQWRSTSGARE